MKKIIISFLFIIIAVEIFIGCRKGPEDPLISFHSRKHRVTGLWRVAYYMVNGTDSLMNNVSTKDTFSIPYGVAGTMTYTKKKVYLYEFDLNGDYIFRTLIHWDAKRDWFGNNPYCTDSIYSFKDSSFKEFGFWTFEGGTNGYKKKELLSLVDSNGYHSGNFSIIELREKEMKLLQSINDFEVEWILLPYSDTLW